MEKSGFLLKLTKIALDALFKLTNAELRIHGTDNIPDQPVLYVINHFTRMETFFLPYVIKNATGKDVLSLAFSGLFGGSFGKVLTKLGAVPTDDPDRDRVIIGTLLTGDSSVLIFPEGQMIKDKKIVERGKYMVFNAGIRRPPHTGAAIHSLMTEFYREKLKYFHETGFEKGINEYKEHFEIETDEMLQKVINQEMHIIPVNLTYFPLRSRRNVVNKIADMFVDELPERIQEELEIEGTMAVDGVDIDINFGKPISIRKYLNRTRFQKRIQNNNLYLTDEEFKKDISFRNEGTRLMYRYMNSIYRMTTVNCEHIFSYILSMYPGNKISILDFKNRVFLAIDEIKKISLKYNHTLLNLTNETLLTDVGHRRYNDFLDALVAENLVSIEGDYLIKGDEKFSRLYEFHTIRKDNIIEVLKNEIAPLDDLLRKLNKIGILPDFYVRKKIREKFLKIDEEIFEADYEQYFIDGESKPKEIGRPFFLKKIYNRKGILLIHGYMSAPEEVRELGDRLYKDGYTVYGVRLRGHGTAPEDLSNRTWEEWLESVNRGYVVLRNTVEKIGVVGFSTGAGLGILESIRRKDAISCMVSINAPLRLSNIASHFAPAVEVWNHLLEKIHLKKGKMEFVTNEPQNPDINYFRNPVHGVAELENLMKTVSESMKEYKTPTLVLQADNDPVVNPVSGMELFEMIEIEDKEYCTIQADKHVIVRGEYSGRVFKEVDRYLKEKL